MWLYYYLPILCGLTKGYGPGPPGNGMAGLTGGAAVMVIKKKCE